MRDSYFELTPKQQEVFLAGFKMDPNGDAYKFVIAHGATGAGKSVATLLGFLKWSHTLYRNAHFIIIGMSEHHVNRLADQIIRFVETNEFAVDAVVERNGHSVTVDTNVYYLFPSWIECFDFDVSVPAHSFHGVIPSGAFICNPIDMSPWDFESFRSRMSMATWKI